MKHENMTGLHNATDLLSSMPNYKDSTHEAREYGTTEDSDMRRLVCAMQQYNVYYRRCPIIL